VRLHRTTGEQPRLRFERDERALLQPLPHRPYHSLVVEPRRSPEPKIRTAQVPVVSVERRPLSHYSELVGGVR
jgi:hypothetical protein